MAHEFRVGHVFTSLTPIQLKNDNSPCKYIYLRAHGGNNGDIYIGESNQLVEHEDHIHATANMNTGDGDVLVTAAQGGADWNSKTVQFSTVAGTDAGTPLASYANDVITLTVNDTVNTTLANINTVIAVLHDWTSAVGNAGNFDPGDVGVVGTTASAVDAVAANATGTLADAGDFTVTSAVSSAAWNNKTLAFVLDAVTPAATPTANYVGSVISVTVNSTTNTTTANINTAIHGLSEWTSNEDTSGEFDPGDAGVTVNTANGVTAVAPTATLTVDDTGALTITSDVTNTDWDGKTVVFILDDATPAGSPTANYVGSQINITVCDSSNTTMANINTVVHALGDWSCAIDNAGSFYPGDGGDTEDTANGVNAVAANAVVTVADAGEITVTADVLTTFWNSKPIVFALDNGTPVGTPTANYVGDTITITVNDVSATAMSTVNTAVDGLGDWSSNLDTGGDFEPGDAGLTAVTANGTGAANANSVVTLADAGEFTITAAVLGVSWNSKVILFVLDTGTPVDTPTAGYAADTITITCNATANTTTANIVSAVDGLTDWQCSEDTGGAFFPGDLGVTVSTSGGVDTIAPNATIVLTDSGDFEVVSDVSTTDWDGKTIVFAIDDSTPADTPTASYAASTITITCNDTVNTTTANIVTAVDGLGDWGCTEGTPGVFDPGDAGVVDTTAGGVNEVTANAVLTIADAGELTITAAAAGASWNDKPIVFLTVSGTPAGTPVANYVADQINITCNDTVNTTTGNINSVVHALGDWDCNEDTGGEFFPADCGVIFNTANGVTAVASTNTVTFGDAGDVDISSTVKSTAWDGKSIAFVIDSATPVTAPTAIYAANTITVTVNSTANTTTARVATAINDLDDWGAAENTGGEFFPGDAGIVLTTANGLGSMHHGGFALDAGEDLKIETSTLGDIYVHAAADNQLLSWLAKT